MKSFTITDKDANQRLDKFLVKALPSLPNTLMYKYIRLKRVKLNGKRAEISTRLKAGDVLDLYINDEFFEKPEPHYDFMGASRNIKIVYEDDNVLLLDKAPGLLCHPDGNEYVDTLIARVKRYMYDKGEYDPDDSGLCSFAPALVNRIDRNTGGIVIAAKNPEALRILNQKMKDRELTKLYLCVVCGKLDSDEGILGGYLEKNEAQNRVYVSRKRTDNSREIRTKYRVLGFLDGLSLIEVELLTGRTHQIRAHFASVGHPLLGDGKYGTNELNKRFGGYKKQLLYSYCLEFKFTTDAGILSYLNGKRFEVENVWFRDAFFDGNIK
ncbi:MAG: RluA family pseudouridine synthase [Clostridiales bacterium]|nr:RluA family pseudouridine synthase [Clostridiales bacterium]